MVMDFENIMMKYWLDREDLPVIPFMYTVNTIMYKYKSVKSEFITYYMPGTMPDVFTYNT